MKRSIALVLGLSLCVAAYAADPKPAAPAAGQAPKKEEKPKPPAYTTVEQAGPDYKIQGEYGEAEAGKAKFGVQVIALGNGKFRAVIHPGGLPGAGWTGEKGSKIEIDGARAGEQVAFQGKGFTGAIPGDGTAISLKSDKGEAIELKKIERKSPTLGLAPSAGAVVLFDGSNTDKWASGKMDERKLLAASSGPKSKDKFADCTLHVEFLLPFMPTAGGQGRANSGVYLQNRYEVQVLDSFGLAGVDNECGGVYKNASPKVNMCLPPLQWQTYDIEFAAARWDGDKKVKNAVISVKHNGVVIHENLEIKSQTGGGEKESPNPGQLQLQNHGNPVFYRNVWLVEKK